MTQLIKSQNRKGKKEDGANKTDIGHVREMLKVLGFLSQIQMMWFIIKRQSIKNSTYRFNFIQKSFML